MPSSASATTERYTLSLHDALPILSGDRMPGRPRHRRSPLLRSQLAHPGLVGAGEALGSRRRRSRRQRLLRAGEGRRRRDPSASPARSEEHTSELQSRVDLVCRLLLLRPLSATLFPYTTLFRSCPATGCPVARVIDVPHYFDPNWRIRDWWGPVKRWGPVVVGVGGNVFYVPAKVDDDGTPALHRPDRKSTRLNSSHEWISYAVFCFCDH